MLCGVTATLGSNPSATATAARPHWGRAVLLCLDGVGACACVLVVPRVFLALLVCLGRAAWCARGRRPAREPSAPRASLGASPRSPARPRRRPRAPQPGPPAPSTPAALVSLCVAGCVVSKPGQAPPPPTGTAAWPSVPSGTLRTGGACVAVCGWVRRLEARPGPAAAHGPRSLAPQPSGPVGTLHTGGACVAVTSPARPYRMGTAAWVSGLSTQWRPVADADWCVGSKRARALPPPTGTAAWPSGPSTPAALVSLCVAGCVVSKPGQAPPPPTGTAAWPSVPSGALRTGGACVAVTSPARPCRRLRAPQPMGSIAWPSRSCGALHAGRANPLRGR